MSMISCDHVTYMQALQLEKEQTQETLTKFAQENHQLLDKCKVHVHCEMFCVVEQIFPVQDLAKWEYCWRCVFGVTDHQMICVQYD